MKMKKTLVLLVILASASMAMAQEQGRGGGPGGDRDGRHRGPRFEDLKACASELGISLPNRESLIGQNSQPSAENREKMKACLDAKRDAHHEKMKACLSAAGITMPDPGTGSASAGAPPAAPDETTRQAIEQCHEKIRTESGSASEATTSTSADPASLGNSLRPLSGGGGTR